MNVSPRISHPLRYCAIAVVALSSSTAALLSPAAAQTRASDADVWEVPRTPHGHPDLQGNWTNATLTPFQRPAGWGPVLTREELAEIEDGQAEIVAQGAEPSDPNRPPPPGGDPGGDDPECIDSATGCYNEVYREPGERVAVVNGEPRSSLVTNPQNGRVPELTPEGRRRVEEYRAFRKQFGPSDHPELRPAGERCLISFGPFHSAGPPMLPNYWYNNNYTIVQNADTVMIMVEMVHDVRIIRLGEPTSLPRDLNPWFGDSWGRWDGNTLVVETTNLNPSQRLVGVPPSADLKVIERFTRVDEQTILYEFTIDDPTTYTNVWGGQIPFEEFDDRLYEYACHEANYALFNVLSGARYEERVEGQR